MTGRMAMAVACGFTSIAVFSCAGARREPAGRTGSCEPQVLPAQIGSAGWTRAAEITRYPAGALFEYIDGAADVYLKYGVVDVVVGEYRRGGAIITADVYRFADSDNAFGMYTTLRPDVPDTITLGVEGFAFGANIVFVKGSYIVNVYGYEESNEITTSVGRIAATIESHLVGTTEKPETFGLLPADGRLAFTEKVFAESFLGHGFLTRVYSIDYDLGGARARVFIAEDGSRTKFATWAENAIHRPESAAIWRPGALAGNLFVAADDYYGDVIVGWLDGKLLGVVGYRPVFGDLFSTWVDSLSRASGDQP